jgi:hypothetical protein
MWKLVCECNTCGAMVYGTEKRSILDDTRERGWQTKRFRDSPITNVGKETVHICDQCTPPKKERRGKTKEEKIEQLKLKLAELQGEPKYPVGPYVGVTTRPCTEEVTMDDCCHDGPCDLPVGQQPIAAIEFTSDELQSVGKGFDVVAMAEVGMSTKEIAEKTGLSERSVRRAKSKSKTS